MLRLLVLLMLLVIYFLDCLEMLGGLHFLDLGAFNDFVEVFKILHDPVQLFPLLLPLLLLFVTPLLAL